MSKSCVRRLAFSIESPLFIAWIVAWVMCNNKSISTATKLAQSGFWVLFPGQLSATNRAFVIGSILVDYFYIEGAHITIYIIVRTWIQAMHRPKAGTGQRSQNEFVRFSWNCNRASPQIIVSSQWQFLKDPHLALILESTFQRLIARFLKLNGILSKRSQMV